MAVGDEEVTMNVVTAEVNRRPSTHLNKGQLGHSFVRLSIGWVDTISEFVFAVAESWRTRVRVCNKVIPGPTTKDIIAG